MAADFRALQQKIRADALTQSSALSSLRDWQSEIKAKDAALRAEAPAPVPAADPTPRAGSEPAVPAASGAPPRAAGESAADHTYDKGYAKWAAFDVDAALGEEDAAAPQRAPVATRPTLSPADVGGALPPPRSAVAPAKRKTVLRAGTGNERMDPAEVERQRGNEAFRGGHFSRAVEAYSRSLGYAPGAATVLSNRAEAHLKLKEYGRALEDASDALEAAPGHGKSLMRRARAAAALGRYRDALADLTAAAAGDPGNKRIAAELRKAREARRAALQRAPRAPLQALADLGRQRAGGEGPAVVPLTLAYAP